MNRGAELLAQRLARGEQTVLAAKLGMDEGYLSRIVRGVRVPGLKTRTLIKTETQIPLEAWDEPPLGEGAEPPEPPDLVVPGAGVTIPIAIRDRPKTGTEDG